VIPGFKVDGGPTIETVTLYVTTLDTTVELRSTSDTLAWKVWPGSALKDTVAAWPTWIFTALFSLNPATTCNEDRSVRVMTPPADDPAVELADVVLLDELELVVLAVPVEEPPTRPL